MMRCSTLGESAGFGGELLVARIRTLIGWLKTNPIASPVWSAHGGANTMFWGAGDLGTCALNAPMGPSAKFPLNNPDLSNVIIAGEYGHTNFSKRDPGMPGTYCMRSVRGIVVPGNYYVPYCARVAKETTLYVSREFG